MKTIKNKTYKYLFKFIGRAVFFFCFLLNMYNVKAQDIHFSQFFSAPLYLNPAFTGANVCSRFSTIYRDQWPGISKTYQSYLLSFDHYIQRYNMGVGLLFENDVAGTGNLKTTTVYPMWAYEVKVNRKFSMRYGIQAGLGQKSINFNSLLFGDQIARGGSVSTASGGNVVSLETPTQTKTYFDIGAGALFYTKEYWGGVSIFHLTQPNTSMMGGEDVLPVKYSIHGGAQFNFNEREKNLYDHKSLTPAFNYQGQKKFDQLEIGMYYTQYIFNIGFWYRGIPVFSNAFSDAIAVIIGIKTDRLNIGYSYDITISKLSDASQGAHEITLSYQLCKFRKKKKRMLVPCPKF